MLTDRTEELTLYQDCSVAGCSIRARWTCSHTQGPGVVVTKRPFPLPPFSTFTGIFVCTAARSTFFIVLFLFYLETAPVPYLLHPIPLQRSKRMAAAQKTPLYSPSAVKYQPRPAASSNGCKNSHASRRHCPPGDAGCCSGGARALQKRVDQHGAVGRVKECAPDALHELQNKNHSRVCMLMKCPAIICHYRRRYRESSKASSRP